MRNTSALTACFQGRRDSRSAGPRAGSRMPHSRGRLPPSATRGPPPARPRPDHASSWPRPDPARRPACALPLPLPQILLRQHDGRRRPPDFAAMQEPEDFPLMLRPRRHRQSRAAQGCFPGRKCNRVGLVGPGGECSFAQVPHQPPKAAPGLGGTGRLPCDERFSVFCKGCTECSRITLFGKKCSHRRAPSGMSRYGKSIVAK